uniref:Uncharacterized protein n=1 Tax=Clytia hemisphaerica TaxID=252671 RepID=A0A7M5V3I4_9CNID
MMEPLKIVSGNKENIWYYYRGNSGPSLNDFLHETFRIRKDLRRFLFFVNQNPVKHSQIDLFRCKEINLAIQVDDDETDLLKHLEPLGLSRVGSIIIKCPNTGSVFCSLPLSQWESFVDPEDVCNEIIKKHRELFYTKIWLAHDGNKLGKDTIIESLFIRENEILENIELTLFVLPNKRVKEVCEMHHLVYLKEINVKFLTGQFTIDLFQQENLLTVGELKRTIYEIKDIAPHLQSLFCYKFSDFQLEGFMEIFSLLTDVKENDSITLNLIVKPAKELQVVIKCAGHLHSETIDLNMKETDTISDIKKEVSKITNHPSSIISILSVENCLWKFGENIVGFDDNDQLWHLKLSETISIKLYAMLQVLVSIKATNSAIHQRSFRITNFKSNKIRNITQVLEKEKKLFGSTPKLVEKPGITLETKLIDIGEELIEFVSQSSSTKCLLS